MKKLSIIVLLLALFGNNPTYEIGMSEKEFISKNKPVKILATSFVNSIYIKEPYKQYFYFHKAKLARVDTILNLSYIKLPYQ